MTDNVREGEAERVDESSPVSVSVLEGLPVRLRHDCVMSSLKEKVPVSVEEGLSVLLDEPVLEIQYVKLELEERLPMKVNVELNVILGKVPVFSGVCDSVTVSVRVNCALTVPVRVAAPLRVAVSVELRVGTTVFVTVMCWDRLSVSVSVFTEERLCVAENTDCDRLNVDDPVDDLVGMGECVSVKSSDMLSVFVAERVEVPLLLACGCVPVTVVVLDAEVLGVSVADNVKEEDFESVDSRVAVPEPVFVLRPARLLLLLPSERVLESVCVKLEDTVSVTAEVGDRVSVGAADGVELGVNRERVSVKSSVKLPLSVALLLPLRVAVRVTSGDCVSGDDEDGVIAVGDSLWDWESDELSVYSSVIETLFVSVAVTVKDMLCDRHDIIEECDTVGSDTEALSLSVTSCDWLLRL